MADSGTNVGVHYYQNEAAANDTLAKVRAKGADGFVVQADVSRSEDINHMFNRVQAEFGELNIFVSNARPDLPEFYQPPINNTLEKYNMALDSTALLLRTEMTGAIVLQVQ